MLWLVLSGVEILKHSIFLACCILIMMAHFFQTSSQFPCHGTIWAYSALACVICRRCRSHSMSEENSPPENFQQKKVHGWFANLTIGSQKQPYGCKIFYEQMKASGCGESWGTRPQVWTHWASVLKRWLPLPANESSRFEVILPGRMQHDRRFTKRPTNLKLLAEIATTPSNANTRKRLQISYLSPSQESTHKNCVSQGNFLQPRVRSRFLVAWQVVPAPAQISKPPKSAICASTLESGFGANLSALAPHLCRVSSWLCNNFPYSQIQVPCLIWTISQSQ